MSWIRIVIWLPLLLAVHHPWRSLGGLVDERTRWLERSGMLFAFPVGWTVGLFAGDPQPERRRRSWYRLGLLMWF